MGLLLFGGVSYGSLLPCTYFKTGAAYRLHHIKLIYIILNTYLCCISGTISVYHMNLNHIISYHNIISYHIITYHTISYHIISYHIISYHIISHHIISYHHITSYHIISYQYASYIRVKYHSYHITPFLSLVYSLYHME
jgi:hypothetical protein